jgi:hypothetical protein
MPRTYDDLFAPRTAESAGNDVPMSNSLPARSRNSDVQRTVSEFRSDTAKSGSPSQASQFASPAVRQDIEREYRPKNLITEQTESNISVPKHGQNAKSRSYATSRNALSKKAGTTPKRLIGTESTLQKESNASTVSVEERCDQTANQASPTGPTESAETTAVYNCCDTEQQAVRPTPGEIQKEEAQEDVPDNIEQQMEPPVAPPVKAGPSFPLDLKQIESVLHKYVQECLDDHEDYVRYQLKKARYARQGGPSPPPVGTTSTPFTAEKSAFDDMPSIELSTKKSGQNTMEFHIVAPQSLASTISEIIVPVKTYKPDALMPPKYSNYVNLKNNILSKNDRRLKYWPYFSDDFDGQKNDLYNNLEERFNNRIKGRPLRIMRQEQAEAYSEYVDDFLEEVGSNMNDILFYLLDPDHEIPGVEMSNAATKAWVDRDIHCQEFFNRNAKKWILVYSKLHCQKPDDYHIALAGLVCTVFLKVCNFSIWHLASRSSTAVEIAKDDSGNGLDSNGMTSLAEIQCVICHLHDCPGHGAYGEHQTSDSEDEDFSSDDTDSNDEIGHNHRQRVVSAKASRKPGCLPVYKQGLLLSRYRGLDDSDKVVGSFSNPPAEEGVFKDDELCSDSCFWKISNRKLDIQNSDWSAKDLKDLEFAFSAFTGNPRSPCFARFVVNTKPCWEIFNKILTLSATILTESPSQPRFNLAQSRKGWSYWQRTSDTHDHEKRKPFRPCSHSSSCQDAKCRCFRENITCEPSCGCPEACDRRFRGCNCEARGRICWQNEKCDCFRLNRECDPLLCKLCGSHEVLDPKNRYNDTLATTHCQNVAMQRGVPKRTLMGNSDIQGWGLFAGEAINTNEFIGEYKGEIISKKEGERRGAVYHFRGLEYLFDLNKTQDIDSTRTGNKTRFINHSDEGANCYAKKMLCNTVQRIGLYAKTDIQPAEELLFNYGKTFWTGDKGKAKAKEEVAKDDARKKEKAAKKQGFVFKPVGKPKTRKPRRNGATGRRGGKRAGSGRKRRHDTLAKPKTKKPTATTSTPLQVIEPAVSSPPKPTESDKDRDKVFDDPDETEDGLFDPAVSSESESEGYAEDADEEEEDDDDDDDLAMFAEENRADNSDDEDEYLESEPEKPDRRRGGQMQRQGWETRKRKIGEIKEPRAGFGRWEGGMFG